MLSNGIRWKLDSIIVILIDSIREMLFISLNNYKCKIVRKVRYFAS